MKPRLPGRWTKIFIGVAALGLVTFVFREKWLLMIGDFLIIQDDLHPADVIHVVAGENYRLDYAIQLYQQGYGKKIFLTGGGWCSQHQVIHESGWRQRALERGVSPEDILIDDGKITSTYSEAQILRNWIDQNLLPIQSVIVVSDPFHMRRAQWTYRKVLGESIEVQMAPVSFEHTSYARAWWKMREGRRYVWTEYQKYAYYIVRYQLSKGRLQEWLISLDTE